MLLMIVLPLIVTCTAAWTCPGLDPDLGAQWIGSSEASKSLLLRAAPSPQDSHALLSPDLDHKRLTSPTHPVTA
jgi:hypothetical protein